MPISNGHAEIYRLVEDLRQAIYREMDQRSDDRDKSQDEWRNQVSGWMDYNSHKAELLDHRLAQVEQAQSKLAGKAVVLGVIFTSFLALVVTIFGKFLLE